MRPSFGDMPAPFRLVSALFAVTAALTIFIGIRADHQGQWLPSVPDSIDQIWTAIDMPIDHLTLARLGHPRALGRQYGNLFQEHVGVNVIAAASIDAFHEPTICMAGYGYSLTAQKYIPLFGPDKPIRAMILRSDTTGQRILLYYWVQDQFGKTTTQSSFRAYQEYGYRLRHGLNATINGRQSCIVRVYTAIRPADLLGRQARRNLDTVSHALYEALRRDNGIGVNPSREEMIP